MKNYFYDMLSIIDNITTAGGSYIQEVLSFNLNL